MAVILIHQLLYRFVLIGQKFHLNKRFEIQEACIAFTNKNATTKNVLVLGVALLYSGRIGETLPELRYINYQKLAATIQTLSLKNLLLSEVAATCTENLYRYSRL